MLIGSNWLLGYSHTGRAADAMIRREHGTKESFWPLIKTFANVGVDALMAPITANPITDPPDPATGKTLILSALEQANERLGRKLIYIDTPVINVDDSPAARREAEAVIRASAKNGSEICLIHHYSTEQLVNKNKRSIGRLPDYLAMIRDAGMIPGVTAHMPEVLVYCDENGYDVETYALIFNCLGFLMQVEVESVVKIIHAAKKPVMTIKAMAAGRTTPYVGLTFNYSAIRPCDMVTVGCLNELEAAEDVEIGMAAIERRLPELGRRSSPASAQSAIK